MVFVGKETKREGLGCGENPAIMQVVKVVSRKQIYVRQTFSLTAVIKLKEKDRLNWKSGRSTDTGEWKTAFYQHWKLPSNSIFRNASFPSVRVQCHPSPVGASIVSHLLRTESCNFSESYCSALSTLKIITFCVGKDMGTGTHNSKTEIFICPLEKMN